MHYKPTPVYSSSPSGQKFARLGNGFGGHQLNNLHWEKNGLNLKGNKLGNERWEATFAAVCGSESSKIASVVASSEAIGPKGAKLIGQALRNSVNPSLTDLNLANNKEASRVSP